MNLLAAGGVESGRQARVVTRDAPPGAGGAALVRVLLDRQLAGWHEPRSDKLTSPKHHVEFGPEDDISGHCEMSGRAMFHQRMFAWLDDVLASEHAT